jgi:hypothetical protein
MYNEQPRYISYLVRLWQARSHGAWVWRASLEDSRTGARHGFADLTRLFAFLEEQTSGDAQADRREPDAES